MLFTSYTFLFLFLPILFFVYLFTPAHRRSLLLLVASYLFYGLWRIDYTLLLLAVTLVGFVGGKWISTGGMSPSRIRVVLPVVLLLGGLGWFKYAGFLSGNWNFVSESFFGSVLQIKLPEILLPVGISFFTFQTLSYVIDVRRGLPPAESFISFASYVALFPQLVAGPIVRYSDVSPDIAAPQVRRDALDLGVVLFMLGFCKKVWIANNVAPAADWAFGLQEPVAAAAWIGAWAYTLQIYFDFSGYSEMAIGLGLMFGFRFPENFRFPYLASNITEFWQRWHISMSGFFRDYLYIPLGGNRNGQLRTLCNLGITMLLAGLWHGAGWTFVLWGAFHGALLAGHRVWQRRRGRMSTDRIMLRIPATMMTLLCVVLGWVLFRAESAMAAKTYFAGMSGLYGFIDLPMFAGRFDAVFYAVMFFGTAFIFVEPWLGERLRRNRIFRAMLFIFFVGAIHELGSQDYNPFLYFQF